MYFCIMKFKSVDFKAEDLDEKGRIVGYLSVFGNKDSDGDVIMQGAYKKTIAERKERIKYLWQHRSDEPIGKFVELSEDNYGLRFVGQLSLDTTKGKDAYHFYKDGVITEHSVGFEVIKGQGQEDYYEMTELKLWEGSAVTWGANPLTFVETMKAEDKIDRLNTEMQRLFKLVKANVPDETKENIIFEMKRIHTLYNALIAATVKHNEPQEVEQINYLELYKSL